MGDVHHVSVQSSLRILFENGTVTGLTDAQLLELFVARRDELAFAAIVERHGPMVQRVCHEVLRDHHDGQDAFQATFLVLARYAGSIQRRSSLASWLYGVGLRVAASVRSARARRRVHEHTWANQRAINEGRGHAAAARCSEESQEDHGMLVHAEIGRLPERFRAAVVLCYLEGRTYEEAASVLNCPIGTIKSRLATARARLRRRLEHLTPAPCACSAELVLQGSPPFIPMLTPLPEPLVQAVIRHATGSVAPASISQVAQEVLKRIFWHRLICRLGAAGAILISTAALATGPIGLWPMDDDLLAAHQAELAVLNARGRQPFEAPDDDRASKRKTPGRPGQPITLTGRVVDERGMAVPGALVRFRLFRSTIPMLRLASELIDIWEAKTSADGRYSIADIRGIEGSDYQHFALDVNAPHYVQFFEFHFAGLGRVAKSAGAVSDVRLERGESVTGRCVGPDGKIEPGAKIRAAFAGKPMSGLGRAQETDADGRFRLTIPPGLAAELIVYPERRVPLPPRTHIEQLMPRRVSVSAGGGDLGDVQLDAGLESIGMFPPAALPEQDPSLYTRVPGGWVPIGQVIAFESTDRGEFGWFPITLACKTDRSGNFLTPALKGSYKIWAAQAHDSGPDDRGPIVSDVPPLALMPRVVDFQGRSKTSLNVVGNVPVAIRGKITGPDGKPAQGVSLLLLAAIGSAEEKRLTTLQWTTTNEEGRYALNGIPQGLTRAFLNVFAEPPDQRSRIDIIASGNFQGRADSSDVSFEPMKRDQDPLDFRLKVVIPDPPAQPRVETAEDNELTKLGEEAQRLDQQFSDELAECKTDAERVALIKGKLPSNLLASRFLDLAKAHPGHPVAISALVYIFQRAAGVGDPDWPISVAREQAIDQVIEVQLRNPDIILFFSALQFGAPSPKAETLLRAALSRSPHREVKAGACYELARFLRFMAGAPEVLKTLKEKPIPTDPQLLVARDIGLRIMQRFAAVDSAKAQADAEQLLEQVKRDFSDVPQLQFMAEGPGNLRISRIATPQENLKTYGSLAEQALFEMRALAVGKVAPDIEGEDVDGLRFKLSDYRGKVVLLTFSGNWCGPCRGMYPQERALVSRYKDRPFALLSINTDPDRETLLESIRNGEITWRCWRDGGQNGPITSRWNVLSFPSIFVIDAKGVIRELGTRGNDLDQTVERLVKEAKAERVE